MCWACSTMGRRASEEGGWHADSPDDGPSGGVSLPWMDAPWMDTAEQPVGAVPFSEVQALLAGPSSKWNAEVGRPQVVTYSFALDSVNPGFIGRPLGAGEWAVFNDTQRASAREALNDWAGISGLTFVEVPDTRGGAGVDIRFSLQVDNGWGGIAYFAPGGDLALSMDYAGETLGRGTFSYGTLLHEIGHAIGFKHPFEGSVVLPRARDNYDNTVLSYTAGPVTGSIRRGLGEIDVDAVRYLYGTQADEDARGVTYAFDPASGLLRHVAGGAPQTLKGTDYRDQMFGTGGGDTLLGAAGDDWLEGGAGNDRLEGDSGFATRTVYGAILTDNDVLFGGEGNDTLLGGIGADSLFGGTGDDLLRGGDGRDLVDGGAGFDTAEVSGFSTSYRVFAWTGGAAAVSIFATSEIPDRMVGIERVTFLGNNASVAVTVNFRPNEYLATHADLGAAFGANPQAGFDHWVASGFREGRKVTFSGAEYLATHADVARAFGADPEAGAGHYVASGRAEGRGVAFDGLEYLATHADLGRAYGANREAGALHFVSYGRAEGRKATFDGLEYLASHNDLIGAYRTDGAAATSHFIQFGRAEGRKTTFDGYEYIASYGDLIRTFGVNSDAGSLHYLNRGRLEGRRDTFDPSTYLSKYVDLRAAFGTDQEAATIHFIKLGFAEGRSDDIF